MFGETEFSKRAGKGALGTKGLPKKHDSNIRKISGLNDEPPSTFDFFLALAFYADKTFEDLCVFVEETIKTNPRAGIHTFKFLEGMDEADVSTLLRSASKAIKENSFRVSTVKTDAAQMKSVQIVSVPFYFARSLALYTSRCHLFA